MKKRYKAKGVLVLALAFFGGALVNFILRDRLRKGNARPDNLSKVESIYVAKSKIISTSAILDSVISVMKS